MAAASEKQTEAAIIQALLEVTTNLPQQPQDCSIRERAGVSETTDIRVALRLYDAALGRSNNRVSRCYTYNETIRSALADVEGLSNED